MKSITKETNQSKGKEKKLNFPKILDCTPRDGGYLNNWQFDLKLIRELYRALSKSGIDYFEVGFRSTNKYFDPKKVGPWRFTPESLLAEVVNGISGIPIALMVDYGKVDLEDIPDKKDSYVSMYRVAVHKDKKLEAIDLCNSIAAKGYEVCIQLMGIVGYSDEDFEEVLDPLKESNITYVYFADSYGSLIPTDIKPIKDRLTYTNKKLGYHAHNNLQLGFANTLEAIRNGIDIVDATVYGMGRGAGNLQTEVLLAFLERDPKNTKYNSFPVLDIIDRYIIKLNQELQWGYDLPYMLSGMFEVHPNYSKALIEYREFGIEDILRALGTIKSLKPVGFKKDLLTSIIQSGFVGSGEGIKEKKSSFDSIPIQELNKYSPVTYIDRHRDKDFLVLANGPSLKKYKKEIAKFITKFKPIIIGVNYLGDLFVPDYHAFSNKKRFIDYFDKVNPSSKLFVSNTFSKEFVKKYWSRYHEIIQHLPELSTDFDIKHGIIANNCRTISILSIAVAIVMGAKRIFVAGMDGYKHIDDFTKNSPLFYEEKNDTTDFDMLMDRHNWNELLLKEIDKYMISKDMEGISIITPTSHKAFYKSIDLFIGDKKHA